MTELLLLWLPLLGSDDWPTRERAQAELNRAARADDALCRRLEAESVCNDDLEVRRRCWRAVLAARQFVPSTNYYPRIEFVVCLPGELEDRREVEPPYCSYPPWQMTLEEAAERDAASRQASALFAQRLFGHGFSRREVAARVEQALRREAQFGIGPVKP